MFLGWRGYVVGESSRQVLQKADLCREADKHSRYSKLSLSFLICSQATTSVGYMEQNSLWNAFICLDYPIHCATLLLVIKRYLYLNEFLKMGVPNSHHCETFILQVFSLFLISVAGIDVSASAVEVVLSATSAYAHSVSARLEQRLQEGLLLVRQGIAYRRTDNEAGTPQLAELANTLLSGVVEEIKAALTGLKR